MGARIVPLLNRSLRHSDPSVRQRAAYALYDLGPVATNAAPALIKGLDDRNAGVRMYSLWALKKQGADSIRRAAPAASRRLVDGNPSVRYYAAELLSQLGAEAAPYRAALMESMLRETNRTVMYQLAGAVQQIERGKRL
jgi:HEAT repeat protein